MKKGWIWAIVIVGLIIIGIASDSGSSSSSRSNYTSSTTSSSALSPKNNDSTKTYTPLSNGTVLSKDNSFFNRGGGNEVEINNSQGSVDSIFKLVSVSTNKSVYTVYIRKGYSVTISDIPDGNYYAYFASSRGEDQDGNLDIYGAEKDEDIWSFKEEIRGDYIYYDSISITLYPVSNGNLETDDVSTSTFENL